VATGPGDGTVSQGPTAEPAIPAIAASTENGANQSPDDGAMRHRTLSR
jgi:hypothetical protein